MFFKKKSEMLPKLRHGSTPWRISQLDLGQSLVFTDKSCQNLSTTVTTSRLLRGNYKIKSCLITDCALNTTKAVMVTRLK